MRKLLNAALLPVCALAMGSCRTDKPPIIGIICIGDGAGGADCVQAGGAKVYKSPSELKNYWMTTQTDEANFSSWCYKIPAPVASSTLESMRARIVPTPGPSPEPMPSAQVVWDERGAHEQ
jgi:hypothetical protein